MKKILLISLVVLVVGGLILSYGAQSAMAAEKGKYGGILKVAISKSPGNFGYSPGIRGADQGPASDVLEMLVRTTREFNHEPLLATSWDVSPDGKTYTFKLRKGVKFHDGTDFNAQAAKYNLDFWIDAKGASLRSLKSVDIVDDHTIRVNLKKRDPLLLWDLCYEPFMMSPTAVEKNGVKWAKTHPVGTGPFKFKSFERNVAIKYVRNDDYWDKGRPYLDGLEYHVIINSMTQTSSLRAGEIDGIVAPKLVDQYTMFEKLGFQTPNWGFNHFGIYGDSKKPESIWANKKFRLAVEYAIDKEAISKESYAGRRQVCYQLFPPDHPMFNPDLKPRKYDPEKAKKLLAEAGYPNGVKTTLTFATHDWGPDFDALQGYLLAVGIDAKLIRAQKPKWLMIRFEGGLVGGSGIVIYVTVPTLVTLKNTISGKSNAAQDMQRPEGLDEVIDKALEAKDPKTRERYIHEASKLLYDDCTFIPFLQQIQGLIMRQGVHGFRLNEYAGPTCRWTNTWIGKK